MGLGELAVVAFVVVVLLTMLLAWLMGWNDDDGDSTR